MAASPQPIGGNQPTNMGVKITVTQVLASIKQLLDILSLWSSREAIGADVSDVYVRLGSSISAATNAFTASGIDTSDFASIPGELRAVLEECLAEDATPEILENYLPDVRRIITNLLQGLRKAQAAYRRKLSGRDEATSSTATSSEDNVNPGRQVRDRRNIRRPSSTKSPGVPRNNQQLIGPPRNHVVEPAVTRLLVSIKQLFESLTSWSNGNVTGQHLRGSCENLTNEFYNVVAAFGTVGIDTNELMSAPGLIRAIVEQCLDGDATPDNLEIFLPDIRRTITTLLQGLRERPSIYRRAMANS